MSLFGGFGLAVLAVVATGSTIGHVRNFRAFRRAIRSQHLLPNAGLIAAAVLTVEGTLAILATTAFVSPPTISPQVGALLGVLLFGAFTAYSTLIFKWRPEAACGCALAERPINFWVPMRAALLAMIALGSLTFGTDALASLGPAELLSLAAAAFGTSVLLWSFPAAMHIPGTNGHRAESRVLA